MSDNILPRKRPQAFVEGVTKQSILFIQLEKGLGDLEQEEESLESGLILALRVFQFEASIILLGKWIPKVQ